MTIVVWTFYPKCNSLPTNVQATQEYVRDHIMTRKQLLFIQACLTLRNVETQSIVRSIQVEALDLGASAATIMIVAFLPQF